MSERLDSIETRLENLSVSEIFEAVARNWDDVEALNIVAQSTASLLLEVYRELKEIKESLKKEQLPSCEFDQT